MHLWPRSSLLSSLSLSYDMDMALREWINLLRHLARNLFCLLWSRIDIGFREVDLAFDLIFLDEIQPSEAPHTIWPLDGFGDLVNLELMWYWSDE